MRGARHLAQTCAPRRLDSSDTHKTNQQFSRCCLHKRMAAKPKAKEGGNNLAHKHVCLPVYQLASKKEASNSQKCVDKGKKTIKQRTRHEWAKGSTCLNFKS
eukprot:2767813-Pleurochrysis_carterae.AAC.1